MRALTFGILMLGFVAVRAEAQRRPIGAEEQNAVVPDEPTGAPAEAAEPTKAAEPTGAARKKAAEAAAAEEKLSIEREEAARAAAEKASREAADKAREQKETAAAKVKAEEEAKQKSQQEAARRRMLNAARQERVLTRITDPHRVRVTLRPGAPEVKAVEEIRLDLAEKLIRPDPTYGDFKPVVMSRLVATVTFVGPVDKKSRGKGRSGRSRSEESRRYRVHALQDAGVYGFHTTPLMKGKYRVDLEGTDDTNRSLKASFEFFPGIWPPPDWEDEVQLNKTVGGRRRPIGQD